MSRPTAVLLVIGVGAALRFWNIDAGLPSRIGVDEPVIAERAIRMMRTGDFNPHFYDYPGLYIYVQLAVGCLRFITGAMSGLWRSVDQFYPEHMFLWARMLNAAIGTLTIALVYRAGVRWGHWVALTAAAIFAFWPNHIRESHFALTDVPLTLVTVLTLLLSLRAFETGRWPWFLAAGAGAGFAAAIKYNGMYALILPLLASAMTNAPVMYRLGMSALAIIASAFAFLMGSPYSFLDLPAFLNAFGTLSTYYRPRPLLEGAPIYVAHLRVAVGQSGALVIVAGILWGTLRSFRDRDVCRWALVTIFPLVYFVSVSTKSLIYARYLLPIIPFLCLIMAVVIVDAITWMWQHPRPLWVRSLSVAVVVLFAVLPVVRNGVQWPAQYGRPTTADVAYARIRELIPKGSRVVVERSVLRLPDSLYRKTDVHLMPARTLEDYASRGINYLVASSTAFGPVLERPTEHAAEYEVYQRVFSRPGHCLSTIRPTRHTSGPEIVICRFDAPIQ